MPNISVCGYCGGLMEAGSEEQANDPDPQSRCCPICIRERAIRDIERLYPPDSPFDCSIGQELLERARRECNDWRHEPTPVLVRLAELNRELDRRQARDVK